MPIKLFAEQNISTVLTGSSSLMYRFWECYFYCIITIIFFYREKNMQTIYTDGIANITLIDGIIRLDLVNITQVEQEKANIRPVAALALSVPALLRTHEQLSQAINKMVEDGILKKNDPAQAVTDGTPA